MPAPVPSVPAWQPVGRRVRLGLLVLAVALTCGLLWQALVPKLRLMAARQARGDAPVPIGLPTEAHRATRASAAPQPCLDGAPGQAGRPAMPGAAPCVGGPMPVVVVPAVKP